MRDPYTVLNVPRKASDAEIKKAFRDLAKKHHPDANAKDPAALKRFQEISAAYELLSDKEKRGQFDRGEIDASGQPQGFQGFRPGQGGGRRQGTAQGPGGFEFNFGGGGAEDVFSDLFGAFGRGGGQRRAPPKPRGDDVSYTLSVTLVEAALGGTRRVKLPSGRELDVKIPAGLRDGQTIRLKGQGEDGPAGAGDALITIAVQAHPWFVRDGNDIRLDLPVTLGEAVNGARIKVPTLAGPVTMTIPPNSNSGAVFRLKGKGIPAHGSEAAGDQYVSLRIALPEPPDPELAAFVKRWSEQRPYDPRARFKLD